MAKQVKWTIYCHVHRESGRRYIGLTKKTWRHRWNRHVYDALKSRYLSNHFHNAIRKYGKDAFDHEILQVCYSLEEANAAEKKWIDIYGTTNPVRGFNLTNGGSHTPHPVRNPWDRPEFREKMLTAAEKKWQDPEFRKKTLDALAEINASMTSEERSARAKALWSEGGYRAKVSDAIRDAWQDPDYRLKVSPAALEGVRRPESRAKISRAALSHASTAEGKAVRSRISRAAWDDPEFREARAAESRARADDPEWRSKCAPKSHANSMKTRCKRGHELSGENVRICCGRRVCRACRKITRARRESRLCGPPPDLDGLDRGVR